MPGHIQVSLEDLCHIWDVFCGRISSDKHGRRILSDRLKLELTVERDASPIGPIAPILSEHRLAQLRGSHRDNVQEPGFRQLLNTGNCPWNVFVTMSHASGNPAKYIFLIGLFMSAE